MRTTFILCLLALVGCGPTPEQVHSQQVFALQQTCIRKHGTPIVENGEFKTCDFPFSFHFRKQD